MRARTVWGSVIAGLCILGVSLFVGGRGEGSPVAEPAVFASGDATTLVLRWTTPQGPVHVAYELGSAHPTAGLGPKPADTPTETVPGSAASPSFVFHRASGDPMPPCPPERFVAVGGVAWDASERVLVTADARGLTRWAFDAAGVAHARFERTRVLPLRLEPIERQSEAGARTVEIRVGVTPGVAVETLRFPRCPQNRCMGQSLADTIAKGG